MHIEKKIKKFWLKIIKKDKQSCWIWQGTRTKEGYGITYYSGKSITASRLSWIISNGEIKKGLLVCHKCDNPPCCNPEHLFLGTYKDNMEDAIRKGRFMPTIKTLK